MKRLFHLQIMLNPHQQLLCEPFHKQVNLIDKFFKLILFSIKLKTRIGNVIGGALLSPCISKTDFTFDSVVNTFFIETDQVLFPLSSIPTIVNLDYSLETHLGYKQPSDNFSLFCSYIYYRQAQCLECTL